MTAPGPSGPRRVFVDTSAFFATIDNSERNHLTAVAVLTRLTSSPSRLFTSNLVLAETHALLLSRLRRGIALQFLDDIDNGTTTVVRVGATDERRARAILRQYDDKDFSLTDATSFSVIERLQLDAAFSFDRDFRQYGLTLLTA